MGSKNLFLKRFEVKYLLNMEQYQAFMEKTEGRFLKDKYFESNISNIYFDTPDFVLIRRSIDKPVVYKEKLRLRTYSTPDDQSKAYCEIKKKFKGVVYKRRIGMEYQAALSFMKKEGPSLNKDDQISKEIEWMLKFYEGLAPAMYISYDRHSYTSADDDELRLTFDRNITWRDYDLDQRLGSYGNKILPDDAILMELKIPGAMPVWFSKILDELKIYPASFSKYGNAYRMKMGKEPTYKAFLRKTEN